MVWHGLEKSPGQVIVDCDNVYVVMGEWMDGMVYLLCLFTFSARMMNKIHEQKGQLLSVGCLLIHGLLKGHFFLLVRAWKQLFCSLCKYFEEWHPSLPLSRRAKASAIPFISTTGPRIQEVYLKVPGGFRLGAKKFSPWFMFVLLEQDDIGICLGRYLFIMPLHFFPE